MKSAASLFNPIIASYKFLLTTLNINVNGGYLLA